MILVGCWPRAAIALPANGIIPVDVNAGKSILAEEDDRFADEVLSLLRVGHESRVFVPAWVGPSAETKQDRDGAIQVDRPRVQHVLDVGPRVEFHQFECVRVERGEGINNFSAELRVQVFRHELPFVPSVERPVGHVANDSLARQSRLRFLQVRLLQTRLLGPLEGLRIDELLERRSTAVLLGPAVGQRWNDVCVQIGSFQLPRTVARDNLHELLLLRGGSRERVVSFVVIIVQRVVLDSWSQRLVIRDAVGDNLNVISRNSSEWSRLTSSTECFRRRHARTGDPLPDTRPCRADSLSSPPRMARARPSPEKTSVCCPRRQQTCAAHQICKISEWEAAVKKKKLSHRRKKESDGKKKQTFTLQMLVEKCWKLAGEERRKENQQEY